MVAGLCVVLTSWTLKRMGFASWPCEIVPRGLVQWSGKGRNWRITRDEMKASSNHLKYIVIREIQEVGR
jgi:hypothetical protein